MLRVLLCLGLTLSLLACSTGSGPLDVALPDDGGACSCTTGERRCNGDRVQICEQQSPTCSSWGEATACPSGACQAGRCPGSCTDQCQGGAARCSSETNQEVCRIGPSGCLEWVAQACGAGRYCGESQCRDAIACKPDCPQGYQCRPTGTCVGGSPTDLTLNVKTVRVSGSITVNGAAPTNDSQCSAANNPNVARARVTFTDSQQGYSTEAVILCKDSGYAFATTLYPGTYAVRVRGEGWTGQNLPTTSYLAQPALVVAADLSNQVLAVRTFAVSGSITVNGAAPTNDSQCSAANNPNVARARVTFTDSQQGYSTEAVILCKDSGYAFATSLYPGTYAVRVRGEGWTGQNLPTASFLARDALVVAGDLSNQVLAVQTFRISGSITVNGAAPTNDSQCSAANNPNVARARVTFTDSSKGYSTEAVILCKDSGYAFATSLYPGTYAVRVRGEGWTGQNLPTASFLAQGALVVAGDLSNQVLAVQTFRVSGSITVNGAAPTNDSQCSAANNPNVARARVTFSDSNKGYSTEAVILCKDSGYTFAISLYPGTYLVRVRGEGWTGQNLPTASFLAKPGLVVAADLSDQVLAVLTYPVSGQITVNGAAPTNDSQCSAANNPNVARARVSFTDSGQGYSAEAVILCKDSGYRFSTSLYPGTYAVRVRGEGWTGQNLPATSYLAVRALQIP